MSDQTANPDQPRIGAEFIIIGALILAVIGLFFYFSSQTQQALRNSPTGFQGLQVWLNSQDQNARSFTGGWSLDPDGIGLNIIPVFDTQLDVDRNPPTTKEELLFHQDEYDLELQSIRSKIGDVKTLLVLPKWRRGMRLTGIGHPALLVEGIRLDGQLRELIDDDGARFNVIAEPFVDFDYASDDAILKARIYVPQIFTANNCTPIIGTERGMLLGRCATKEEDQPEVLLLADPDLLSNHGLRLGDNAHIARDLLAAEAGGKDILIDYSEFNWFIQDDWDFEERERTWDDLKRFFQFPFLTLWIAGAILLGLSIWRSSARFGPPITATDGLGAAKHLAIRAHARLMRLTHQDGALVSEYAHARMAAVATRLFGPTHGMDDQRAFKQIKRLFPQHAKPLTRALFEISQLPPHTRASDAINYVDDLENILEQIDNDT